MTVTEFVNRSLSFPHYFDVLGIREEAKKEIEILQQNLFVLGKIEKVEVPEKYSQAYLFKVIQKEKKLKGFQVKSKGRKNQERQGKKELQEIWEGKDEDDLEGKRRTREERKAMANQL